MEKPAFGFMVWEHMLACVPGNAGRRGEGFCHCYGVPSTCV